MTNGSPLSSIPCPSARIRIAASVSGTCLTQTATSIGTLLCCLGIPPGGMPGPARLRRAHDLARDHHSLDLGRPLVDLGDLGVAEVALVRILLYVPRTAEGLHRLRRRPHRRRR